MIQVKRYPDNIVPSPVCVKSAVTAISSTAPTVEAWSKIGQGRYLFISCYIKNAINPLMLTRAALNLFSGQRK